MVVTSRCWFGRPVQWNLIKAVTDAITDTQRVWLDDSQIYQILATKSYGLSRFGCSVRIDADWLLENAAWCAGRSCDGLGFYP